LKTIHNIDSDGLQIDFSRDVAKAHGKPFKINGLPEAGKMQDGDVVIEITTGFLNRILFELSEEGKPQAV
jgi:hypothetical protein